MELLYCILGVGVMVVVLMVIQLPVDRSVAASHNAAQVRTTRFPPEAQDVLVGTLRNPEQLDVCLQCGFYHIPCCQVEDTEHPIRYIAIYQSMTLFGGQAGVRYYGKVSECITVPRYQITQVYSESDEPYLLFRVQEWQQLPAAVLPKETAFVSKRTNLFCLLHSVEVPQLWSESREEFALYEMLYHAAANANAQSALDISGCTVRVQKGRIRLYCDRKCLWSCTFTDFKETPYSVMRCLRGYMGL